MTMEEDFADSIMGEEAALYREAIADLTARLRIAEDLFLRVLWIDNHRNRIGDLSESMLREMEDFVVRGLGQEKVSEFLARDDYPGPEGDL